MHTEDSYSLRPAARDGFAFCNTRPAYCWLACVGECVGACVCVCEACVCGRMLYVHVNVHLHAFVRVRACVCGCVCVAICKCASICVCMSVCLSSNEDYTDFSAGGTHPSQLGIVVI